MEWIRRQCDIQDQRRDARIEILIDLIRANAITIETIKASGKATPLEIKKIEAALAQN